MEKNKINYLLLRLGSGLLALLPYCALHAIGRFLGSAIYYLAPRARKKTLANIAHAKSLNLNREQERSIAKGSFQSLMITCLEYAKFAKDPKVTKRFHCENPEYAQSLIDQGQGVIFFCAHQANWEALFIEGTQRMPGVAIGNNQKNPYLTKWVNSIRERFGGKIIPPKLSVKEGMRAIKQGKFLGIVGDQALPGNGIHTPFLGTPAWTSPLPAILSYKLNCPTIFASIKRKKGRYYIHYSDPIWPSKEASLQDETMRIMSALLRQLEQSIAESPDQWMWQHNRWKQETPDNVYYQFRHESIAIILPEDSFDRFAPLIPLFEQIYPHAFLTLIHPEDKALPSFRGTTLHYGPSASPYRDDLRVKLIFDFTNNRKLKKHYLKTGTLEVFSYEELEKEALKKQGVESADPREITIKAICRPKFFSKLDNQPM